MTDAALEAIFTCWAANMAGKVFAPDADWLPAFEEARERGWLDREMRDEVPAYSLSAKGDVALAVNRLLSSGSVN